MWENVSAYIVRFQILLDKVENKALLQMGKRYKIN
jgi:hypothetical protein